MRPEIITLQKIFFLGLVTNSAFGGEISSEAKNCSQVNVIHQDLRCDGPGRFPLKDTCEFFYECVRGINHDPSNGTVEGEGIDSEGYLLVKVRCPEGTHFDGMECVPKNRTDEECRVILCPALGEFTKVPAAENLNSNNMANVAEKGHDNDTSMSTSSTGEDDVTLGDDPEAFRRSGVYQYKPDNIQGTTPEPNIDLSSSSSSKSGNGGQDGGSHSHGHGHGHGGHAHSHGKRKIVKNGGSTVNVLNVFRQTIAIACFWLVLML